MYASIKDELDSLGTMLGAVSSHLRSLADVSHNAVAGAMADLGAQVAASTKQRMIAAYAITRSRGSLAPAEQATLGAIVAQANGALDSLTRAELAIRDMIEADGNGPAFSYDPPAIEAQAFTPRLIYTSRLDITRLMHDLAEAEAQAPTPAPLTLSYTVVADAGADLDCPFNDDSYLYAYTVTAQAGAQVASSAEAKPVAPIGAMA